MAQITYINKSFINENPDVAAQYKVSASDMNEIKTVVNNNANLMGDVSTLSTGSPNVVSSINTISKYSTTEQKIGTWEDGKPLYRKSVFLNSLPNNTSTTYQHNISNVKSIWFDKTACFAIWNYEQDNQFTNDLPYFNYSGNHIYLANANKTGFEIVTINDRTSLKGYVTLLYTKTTD